MINEINTEDEFYSLKFYCSGSTIVCNYNGDIGISTPSQNDTYNVNIGKLVSLCKATGKDIPDFILKDWDETKIKVKICIKERLLKWVVVMKLVGRH